MTKIIKTVIAILVAAVLYLSITPLIFLIQIKDAICFPFGTLPGSVHPNIICQSGHLPEMLRYTNQTVGYIADFIYLVMLLLISGVIVHFVMKTFTKNGGFNISRQKLIKFLLAVGLSSIVFVVLTPTLLDVKFRDICIPCGGPGGCFAVCTPSNILNLLDRIFYGLSAGGIFVYVAVIILISYAVVSFAFKILNRPNRA